MTPAVDALGGLYWPWHRWFAWHPVWTPQRGWVWLRMIERRFVFKDWLPAPVMASWHYRVP